MLAWVSNLRFSPTENKKFSSLITFPPLNPLMAVFTHDFYETFHFVRVIFVTGFNISANLSRACLAFSPTDTGPVVLLAIMKDGENRVSP